MYWQNHRSSTIEVKPKYELDDGTPRAGMDRIMSWDAVMPLVAAPRVPHVTGAEAVNQIRSVKKDFQLCRTNRALSHRDMECRAGGGQLTSVSVSRPAAARRGPTVQLPGLTLSRSLVSKFSS